MLISNYAGQGGYIAQAASLTMRNSRCDFFVGGSDFE